MAISNIVLAGDYKGNIDYANPKKGLYIYGAFGLGKKTFINKETVEKIEVLNEESNTSMSSGIARGIAGAVLFGGVGAIAGAASAKKKCTYRISITFKNGTKCLCELDDKMYKNLETVMY